ncbi:MAG: butanediol dehydrogenase [Chloroflexota bacterium]|nr:MAG: butanediol dehydrogenase [Chloroflexota bacterium]
MKAALWHARQDVRVMDVDEPSAGLRQVKIRVARCGICGTDVNEYRVGPIFISSERPHPLTGKMAPVVLGHEFVGTIVEVGPGVQDLATGDRVTASGFVTCHECAPCQEGRPNHCKRLAGLGISLDGAMAEYVVVPAELCYKVPDSVSDVAGALIEPLAVGMRAVRRGRLRRSESAAIIGAGPIGLSALLSAKLAGAAPIFVVEPVESRRQVALQLGATHVCDPLNEEVARVVRRETGGRGVDLAVECVGRAETIDLALRMTGKAGRISVPGTFHAPIPTAFARLQGDEKELIGSNGYLEEFAEAVACVATGKIDPTPMVSDIVPLAQAAEAFAAITAHPDKHLKVLIAPA